MPKTKSYYLTTIDDIIVASLRECFNQKHESLLVQVDIVQSKNLTTFNRLFGPEKN